MTGKLLLAFSLAGLTLLSVTPAVSQAQAAMTPEEREIRAEVANIRFTMPELRSWYAAQIAMARYQHDHPDQELQEEDFESLAAFQRKLDTHPEFSRILRSNGLPSRRFALLTGAWGLATLARSRVERGATPAAAASETGTSVENVTLLTRNAAEIRELEKKLAAAGGVNDP